MEEGPAAAGAPTNSRGRKAMMLLAVAAVMTAVAGFWYWSYRGTHLTTDDAFVEGRIHRIAARIQGTVVEVLVDDNQVVKAGHALLRIDPEPFDVRQASATSVLAAASAALEAATKELAGGRAELVRLHAAVEAARARLALAAARLTQAGRDFTRSESLIEKKTISREQYEKTSTEKDVAQAGADLAREKLRLAEAAIPVQEALVALREARVAEAKAVVAERQSQLDEAKLLRSYAVVEAPAEGYVTRKDVEVGQVVSPGQALMAVTALDDVWVLANFKETQIERIRPGLPATIEVDTYPGKTFRGKVESLMAGTGSAFSLFPPENATGNYVKVVQRVPVKIVLEKGEDPAHILRLGMSVVPTVLAK